MSSDMRASKLSITYLLDNNSEDVGTISWIIRFLSKRQGVRIAGLLLSGEKHRHQSIFAPVNLVFTQFEYTESLRSTIMVLR